MITKENLKNVLITLGYKEVTGELCEKNFGDFKIVVDVLNKKIIYPNELKVNREDIKGFSSNENFVVLECVTRLLSKGYKPISIELEPSWKLGHGNSGGRADIMVKDLMGNSFLMIECKTDGDEFKKEWENMKENGGQLFSYAQQVRSTQYICLYSSGYNNIINYNSNIISLVDNENILYETKGKSFKDATSVKELYEAWKEIYKLDYFTNGLFEDNIELYKVGYVKKTISDLKEPTYDNIQKKYNEFATILRKHNVSGRENAFDKLVNLFLCKIVDETRNPDDLKFYWKGFQADTYFDLIDRLQLLYQSGMKDFLNEDVTYIDNNQIDNAFRFIKKDPDSTKDTIKDFFKQLKFYTNNDFAFIDVHNERLFYQNAKILLEVVQILQDLRLKTETENQFLGDMFEGFLDSGVKQSEGQFFTPLPIVKFIMDSLPLETIYMNNKVIPKAIDYACGAGHFLNELALSIKSHVPIENLTKYYENIVGIEKEYRLSKVSKVSAFMYGQDQIKIIYGDALGKIDNVKDGDYDILVANPPYAVKGFLKTLSDEERNKFELNKLNINTDTNNSIETFFIERAKQLLKPNVVAAIILPYSILSNSDSLYTKTREIIIKYFQIVAIVQLGKGTFSETGTNTVTLFLRIRETAPDTSTHFQNRVDDWFNGNNNNDAYKDEHYIEKYCNHIGIKIEDYKTLLNGNPSNDLLSYNHFNGYPTNKTHDIFLAP